MIKKIEKNDKQRNPGDEFTKQDVLEIVFIFFWVNFLDSSESLVDEKVGRRPTLGMSRIVDGSAKVMGSS